MYSRKNYNVNPSVQHTFNPMHEINRLNIVIQKAIATNQEFINTSAYDKQQIASLSAKLSCAESVVQSLMLTNAQQGEYIEALTQLLNQNMSQVAIELSTPPKSSASTSPASSITSALSTTSSTSPTQLWVSSLNNIMDQYTTPQKFK